MKRVHVYEFADSSWFPRWIHGYMTDVLVALSRAMGVTPALAQLIARTLRDENLGQIVDLGSGSGGVMPEVLALVRKSAGLEGSSLLLTDLRPNATVIASLRTKAQDGVRYEEQSVNALDLASAPQGLKTMTNAFHHLRPEQAREMLGSAQESRQPLLVYELSDNAVPFLVWLLMLPFGLVLVFLSCWVLTLQVRPLTLHRLFFTYPVPIVPLFYAWDGQASFPRIYSPEDLDELIASLPETSSYRWEKGSIETEKGRKAGQYLLGSPC